MRFCPRCGGFLYLQADKTDTSKVHHVCKNCTFQEPMNPKTPEEALILETNFRSGSSANGAASGITVNAYTLADPTLPHLRGSKAPACTGCPVDAVAEERDVLYIKTDPVNLKFQYICMKCKEQWTN